LKNGLGIGLGFFMVLLVMGVMREIGGTGAVFGFQLFQNGLFNNSIFMVVPGGLLILGGLCALYRWINEKYHSTRKGAM
jgi:Na+-translocating ferredoxin:NAD+ oxidoreductase subunit E